MARRFTKVSEEEIGEAFFYPSDLVKTKTTIPLRVGEERWIYTSTLRFGQFSVANKYGVSLVWCMNEGFSVLSKQTGACSLGK